MSILTQILSTSNLIPIQSNLQVELTPYTYPGSGNTWNNNKLSYVEATLLGNPTFIAGKGFQFNGTSQFGYMPSYYGITDFTSNQNYTVEIWINPLNGQSDPNGTAILEKWNDTSSTVYPYIFDYSEGYSWVNVGVRDTTNTNSFIISAVFTQQWTQVVGSFDFSTKIFSGYKNGSPSTTGSLTNITGTINNSSNLNIARRGLNYGQITSVPYKGSIGIIRIYNKALTSTEVKNNYISDKWMFGL